MINMVPKNWSGKSMTCRKVAYIEHELEEDYKLVSMAISSVSLVDSMEI